MRYRRSFVTGATYFFTLVFYERQPLLADASNVDRWHRAIAKVQNARPFVIEAEVILPDHLHVMWTLPEGDSDYATRIRLVKTHFTKEHLGKLSGTSANESRASKGERDVWQRRYWEHVIRDDHDFGAHLDYIHYNPVRHGFTARPADWPHSTFKDWVAKGAYDPWWGSDEMHPLPQRALAE